MSEVRGLGALTREELAVLVREYLLGGQMIDRAGMPHVIAAHGREVMGEIAIDEWMGASPIYTRRTQRLLGFVGDDVETIFKGMQFDIGAPPEFMDFRYRVTSRDHGEFWLDHCGALMDVEPMGDDYVRTMCHTIEDPTFDATAIATNRRARIRPIHRPPRLPADRHPHCHWTATIDPTVEPLPDPSESVEIMATLLAAMPVAEFEPAGEGWHDYTAPMDPDLRLEMFSAPALVALAREVATQSHLLTMSLTASVRRRHGADDAVEIGARHFAGSVGLTSERLRDALGIERSIAGLAQVLELHPAFQPRSYVDVVIELDEAADTLRVELRPCTAVDEPDQHNWLTLLRAGHDEAITTMVQGVDLHHRAERVDPSPGGLAAWRVWRAEEPAKESSDVALTRFSTGATFEFSETPVELRSI